MPVLRIFAGTIMGNKYGKRFVLGWLLSSIVMFALSFLWHGVILNDYAMINYPFTIYLVSASVVYLVIGFLLSRIFIAEFIDQFSRKAVPRGIISGTGLGVIVYMVALVVGVTFNSGFELKYLLLDVIWQMLEQAMGGIAVGVIYLTVFEFIPHPVEEEGSDHK